MCLNTQWLDRHVYFKSCSGCESCFVHFCRRINQSIDTSLQPWPLASLTDPPFVSRHNADNVRQLCEVSQRSHHQAAPLTQRGLMSAPILRLLLELEVAFVLTGAGDKISHENMIQSRCIVGTLISTKQILDEGQMRKSNMFFCWYVTGLWVTLKRAKKQNVY